MKGTAAKTPDLPPVPKKAKKSVNLKELVPARFKQHPLWRMESFLVGGAVIAGLLSAALSHGNQAAVEDRLRRAYATTEVLAASKDLPAGTQLDRSMVRKVPSLGANVSKNTVTSDSGDLVLGRATAVDLKAGDVLLLSMVQGVTDAKNIAEKIPPGKRLFTLTIDNKSTGYGFVNPNDHVDIYAHLEMPARGMTTFTILEDVTLVSVGARSVLNSSGRVEGTDVSFFVTPDEFEQLAFAQKRGTFSLSLRNPRDIAKTDAQSVATGKKGMDINRFLDSHLVNAASGGGDLEVIEDGKVSVQKAPAAKK